MSATADTTQPDWSAGLFLESKSAQRPDYLVDTFLPEGSLTMLAADPGSGKTFLMLFLALAVSRGEPFLGLATKRSGVLFIGEDAPTWDYAEQLRAVLRGEQAPDTLHILPQARFRLLDSGWRARLSEYITAHSITLVIIDTIRAVHDMDENDSKQMHHVMQDMQALCAIYGVAIVFLHHTPKGGEGGRGTYRGSTTLEGSCDVFIALTATNAPNAKALTLQVKKARARNMPAEIKALIQWSATAATLTRFGAPSSDPTVTTRILDRLATGPAFIEDLTSTIPPGGRKPKTIRGQVDAALGFLQETRRISATRVNRKKRYELAVAEEEVAA